MFFLAPVTVWVVLPQGRDPPVTAGSGTGLGISSGPDGTPPTADVISRSPVLPDARDSFRQTGNLWICGLRAYTAPPPRHSDGVLTGGARTRQQQLISTTRAPARQHSQHREVHLVSQ